MIELFDCNITNSQLKLLFSFFDSTNLSNIVLNDYALIILF